MFFVRFRLSLDKWASRFVFGCFVIIFFNAGFPVLGETQASNNSSRDVGSVDSQVPAGFTIADKDDLAHAFKSLKEIGDAQQHAVLIKSFEKYKPRTEQEINLLSQEMEGSMAPLAQQTIRKTTDTALVPVLIQTLRDKSAGRSPLSGEKFATLNPDEQTKYLRSTMNSEVLIETLGELRDPRIIPALKPFLDDKALSYQASTALSKTGDPAILDELLQRLDNQREINLSGFGHTGLSRVVREIDNPATSKEKRSRLIGQIKGSKDPETKILLKDLALTHQDPDVRNQAGLAYVNAILMGNNDAADQEFIIQWGNSPNRTVDDELAKTWMFNAMDKTWTPRYVPIVIKMLTNGQDWLTKCKAAKLLGRKKVTMAVPYLESVLKDDKIVRKMGDVNGIQVWLDASFALKDIPGKKYFVEVYDSDFRKNSVDLKSIKEGKDSRFKLLGGIRP